LDAKLKDPLEGFAHQELALAIEERFLANRVVTQKSIGQESLLSFSPRERGFHIDVVPDVSVLRGEIKTIWAIFSKTADWKWRLSYRVAIVALWEEIPYETFMDSAFSPPWDGRELREETRAVAAVANDFEKKGRKSLSGPALSICARSSLWLRMCWRRFTNRQSELCQGKTAVSAPQMTSFSSL
jgi:hypothetical protein